MKIEHSVQAVTFSPDGQWIAAGSGDFTIDAGSVQVWEAATGRDICRMEHEDQVNDVVFSPDGRWIASGSRDGTARVWPLRMEDLIAEACARLSTNLTREEWKQYIPGEPYRKTCPNLPVPEE